MEYLIKNIIERMEQSGSEFSTERNTVQIDPDKHSPEAMGVRNKGGKNCCS